MNSTAVRPVFDTTSAAGAMLRQVREPFLAGVIFVGLGTSGAAVTPPEVISCLQGRIDQTNAGVSLSEDTSAGGAIAELRRLSGLTWEQLARLFRVSRRALHFWASGKAMAPGNEEHLQRLLSVVRQMDRGTATANRGLLLVADENGNLPIDLLAVGAYDQALSLMAPGGVVRRSPASRPDGTARSALTPRRPQELVAALQDRVHPSSGHLRGAKPVGRGRRS